MKPTLAASLLLTLLLSARAEPERPFVLWTAEDIHQMKSWWRDEAWFREAWARESTPAEGPAEPILDLFRMAVLDDEAAAARAKSRLLGTVRSAPPLGSAQWANVVRYDLLHATLSAEERAEVEAAFRSYIRGAVFERDILDPDRFNPSARFSRYDAWIHSRTNWLPNITFPRKLSANLMAAALGDEALVRRTWDAYGSLRWYLDEYLGDTGFYSEEFGKMQATPGEIILYAQAVERLGLEDLGFGYTGRGGATLRGHLRSLFELGYPRVDLGSDRPRYPMVTMGDLRQGSRLPTPAFQHAIATGHLPTGEGGDRRWASPGAWGGERRGNHAQWDGYSGFTHKMQHPLWLEFAHRRWPDDGFGYFLAAMRAPGQDRYLPSPWFLLPPVSPEGQTPPAMRSAIWPERGFAVLRAQSGRAFWESPAPAAAVRLGAPYAHSVNDSYALLGLFAHHRPFLLNRQVTPGYAQDWSRSVQSHHGFRVNGHEPSATLIEHRYSHFDELAQVVAVVTDNAYPGTRSQRTWVLTPEYLVDLVSVRAIPPPPDVQALDDSVQTLDAFVHALGVADGDWPAADWPTELHVLAQSRSQSAAEDGSVVFRQVRVSADSETSVLPAAWYDRKAGIRVWFGGVPGAQAWLGQTPLPLTRRRTDDGKTVTEEVPSEVGGETLLLRASGQVVNLVRVYEPFVEDRMPLAGFRTLVNTPDGVVIEVTAEGEGGFRDLLILPARDGGLARLDFKAGEESFGAAGPVLLRIQRETMTISGPLQRFQVHAPGVTQVVANGFPVPAGREGDALTYPVK